MCGTYRQPVFDEGGDAREHTCAGWEAHLQPSLLGGKAELRALEVCGCVDVGADDGEKRADHGVLYGPRVWQH